MEDGAAEAKRDRKTAAEVWLGTTWRDDADAYARLVAECLRLFAHQVVYMHHGLPESSFRTATFCGLFLKECTERDAADYIDRCYNTLRRWATFQRLRTFTVAYVNETTQKNALAYEVNFCDSCVAPQQQLPNAGEELDELRLQMRKVLFSLQCGPSDLLDDIAEPVALRIQCALLENTTVSDREHVSFLCE
ncbi:hypothetical protein AAVH_05532 [Aphelenchoides avenae]|nr:hypothetical protein AAVH_05532 [Aphelenchus avenae]